MKSKYLYFFISIFIYIYISSSCNPIIRRNSQLECGVESPQICVLRAKYPSPLLRDSAENCHYTEQEFSDEGAYSHVHFLPYPNVSLKSFLSKLKGRITDTLIERNRYASAMGICNIEFRFGEDSALNVEIKPDKETLESSQGHLRKILNLREVENYDCGAIRIFSHTQAIYYPAQITDKYYTEWDNWARNALSIPIKEALKHTPYSALDTSIVVSNGFPVLSFYFCDNLTMDFYFEEDSVTFPHNTISKENPNFPDLVTSFLSQQGRMDMFLGRMSYKDFLLHHQNRSEWISVQNNYVKLAKPRAFLKGQQYISFFAADINWYLAHKYK